MVIPSDFHRLDLAKGPDMPDLIIDTDAIRRSRTVMVHISDKFHAATAGFTSVSGDSVAQADLRAQLDDLGSAWGIGLKKLGEYAGDAGRALGGVADACEHTDRQLADAVTVPQVQTPVQTQAHVHAQQHTPAQRRQVR